MFLIALIDKLVPSEEKPHEVKEVLNDCQTDECRRIRKENESKKLMRTGVLTALAIGIHNFPEDLLPLYQHYQI